MPQALNLNCRLPFFFDTENRFPYISTDPCLGIFFYRRKLGIYEVRSISCHAPARHSILRSRLLRRMERTGAPAQARQAGME
jgi:hypothetical protein